jgi:hypothetical protein
MKTFYHSASNTVKYSDGFHLTFLKSLIRAELQWDEETIEHIWERHHLTIEEVDEAFHDPEALIHAGGKQGHQVAYEEQKVEDI